MLSTLALILRILFWPLRVLQTFLFPFSDADELSPAVTAKAAQQFVTYLRTLARNNNSSSQQHQHHQQLVSEAWSTVGFEAAKEQAVTNQTLLVVYLHSPLHRMADYVSQSFLNHEAFLQFIRQPQVTAIGVSIHTAQGVKLASILDVSAFPALVVLQPDSAPNNTTTTSSNNNNTSRARSTPMQLVLRAETSHNLTTNKLLPHLTAALTRHQVIAADREARRLQREEEAALRRQQDEEYQATLLADQERERQIQEERRKQQQEEERIAKEEQDRLAAMQSKKQAIRPEPTAGQKAATIRFVLPSGAKINRKFHADDTIGTLRSYIHVYFHETAGLDDIGTVGLSTNFPRKTYNEAEHADQTLHEAGLCPQAVLMVQDLDL